MTSHTLNPASMRDVLTALLEHIDTHRLPAPGSLYWSSVFGTVRCQMTSGNALSVLADWADTLDQAAVTLYRVASGTAHLEVTGRLAGVVPLHLFTPYRAALHPRYRHLLAQGEPVKFTLRQLRAAASHP